MKIRIKKNLIGFILYDIAAIVVSFIMAYFFRYGVMTLKYLDQRFFTAVLIATPIFFVSYILSNLYNTIWKYAGFREYLFGIAANVIAGMILLVIQIFERLIFLPMVVLSAILATFLTLGIRIAYRTFLYMQAWLKARKYNDGRVMIIGAGEAAVMAINEMRANKHNKLYPVCAIDDDKQKIGTYISGVPVAGDINAIVRIAEEKRIDIILLAIPSLSVKRKKEIIDICKKTSCSVKTMPNLYEGIMEDRDIRSIRNIQPEELLGREKIRLDEEKLRDFYAGKTILITGGAGTVGSNICKLLMKYEPGQVIVLDINEYRLSEFQSEISKTDKPDRIKFVIGSVKDQNNMNNILMTYRPQIVYHCASHNKIDYMNENLGETVKNNIFGTLNVAKAADRFGAEDFIYISSDKAANPVDILGASKRISEMLIQSMNKNSKTRFTAVRFGNIMQSTCEYLQRFKDELSHEGPLTVENRELTKYFMTMTEAVSLIIQSAMMAEGGEIFVLDMGKPVRIYDLARDYIKLSGYDPDTEIEIKITGAIINGDVHDEVLTDPEGVNPTGHERINTARSVFDNLPELTRKLEDLTLVLDKGSNEVVSDQVVQTVRELVPNFYYMAFEDVMMDNAELIKSSLAGKDSKRIYLSSPHMGGMEQIFVQQAFDTNWIAPLGPNVDEFEKEVQRHVDIGAAAAMTTGTAAIHMALRCLGVSAGDLIFCSSLTFSGSCNPIIYEQAIPVFIDSERESWNMSPYALKKAMDAHAAQGKLPKAVIVVNLYGQSADYDSIKQICDEYNVPIIEDAAESIGATYKGKKSGTIGKFGVFSFNGNKIITTSGGGMLVSEDEIAIKKVKFSITQARDQARHYQHSELGFNYRMSNVLAGIGRGQLRVLDQRIQQKKAIYDFYKKAFADIPDIEMMPVADFGVPNYWLSSMTIKEGSSVKPLDVMIDLEKEFIEARPVWKPMNLQPFFMKYDFYNHNDEGISVGEDLFNRGICLPSDTKMKEYDLAKVVRIIKGCWDDKNQT